VLIYWRQLADKLIFQWPKRPEADSSPPISVRFKYVSLAVVGKKANRKLQKYQHYVLC